MQEAIAAIAWHTLNAIRLPRDGWGFDRGAFNAQADPEIKLTAKTGKINLFTNFILNS